MRKKAKEKKPIYKRKWFIALCVFFVLGGIGNLFDDTEDAATDPPPAASVIAGVSPSEAAAAEELQHQEDERRQQAEELQRIEAAQKQAEEEAQRLAEEERLRAEEEERRTQPVLEFMEAVQALDGVEKHREEFEALVDSYNEFDADQRKLLTSEVKDKYATLNTELRKLEHNDLLKTTTVVISATGTKYHRPSCRTLKYAGTETTAAKAISRGYGPCGVCNPISSWR